MNNLEFILKIPEIGSNQCLQNCSVTTQFLGSNGKCMTPTKNTPVFSYGRAIYTNVIISPYITQQNVCHMMDFFFFLNPVLNLN